MAIRTQDDLNKFPCLYKIKDFDKSGPPTNDLTITKIKRLIPKLDENGNVVYKTVVIPITKGCACKGNKKVEYQEKKVADMVETWVDGTAETSSNAANQFTICKLYGTVKRSICENCKTYKKK